MNRLFNILLFLGLVFFISNCDSTNPKPPETKPSGYQEDIQWPSLIDSPWPMYHHDAQNSGRSKYPGPSRGNIVWKYELSKGRFSTSPIIFNDSTVIAGLSGNSDTLLIGLNISTAKEIWSIQDSGSFPSTQTVPLATSDSGLIFTSEDSQTLNKIFPPFETKWEVPDLFGINSGLNIDKTGNIIFITDTYSLYSVNSSGNINFKYLNNDFRYGEEVSTAISPDSKFIYIPGVESTLYGFNLVEQKIEFSFGNGSYFWGPAVDSKGNIYFFSKGTDNKTKLFCLSEYGEILWEFEDEFFFGDPVQYSKMTIGKSGNIYFAFNTYLFSVNYNGELNWKWQNNESYFINSPIISDSDENIYLIANFENNAKAFSIDKSGNERWEVQMPGEFSGVFSPAITNGGKMLVASFNNKYLYCIE